MRVMKKVLLLFIMACLFSLKGMSQSDEPTFTVKASADSIYFGNKFKVTFILENAQGDNFLQPNFADFQQVSNQMMSSRMSVINGEMSQQVSYSFYLDAKEVGRYFIEPASIEVDGIVYETEPYEIFIMANPEGIKQPIEGDRWNNNSFFQEFDMTFPPAPNLNSPERKEMEQKKKKRKTTRL